MKVELHLHTNRYSTCAVNTPEEMMHRLLAAGYNAVYITEHDAVWRDRELAKLQRGFPDLRIFPGVEVSITSHHVLVLGTNDRAYLNISDETELLEKARADGHLTILAHPFRWGGGAMVLQQGLLPDAIEHQSCNHDPDAARESLGIADRLELPLVNTGDAHGVEMLGRYWVETARPIESANVIRTIIARRQYVNRTSYPKCGGR